MTDGPKKCRDMTELTEGIIILSAVTQLFIYFINRKKAIY